MCAASVPSSRVAQVRYSAIGSSSRRLDSHKSGARLVRASAFSLSDQILLLSCRSINEGQLQVPLSCLSFSSLSTFNQIFDRGI
jgi:hypothetical protein